VLVLIFGFFFSFSKKSEKNIDMLRNCTNIGKNMIDISIQVSMSGFYGYIALNKINYISREVKITLAIFFSFLSFMFWQKLPIFSSFKANFSKVFFFFLLLFLVPGE
jgi:hypothetical protein